MQHTIVVGGGIAGLSLAWQLASRGMRRVTLFEREPFVGTHSSARNAQIWLPIDDDETTGPLALRSAEIMTSLAGSESAWLRRGDAIGIGREESIASIERGAIKGGCAMRAIDRAMLLERSPLIEGATDE